MRAARRPFPSSILLGLALLALLPAAPARGQIWSWVSPDGLNRRLAGQVVDFTHNHGADRRIPSAVLGQPRDLYVYLPPGYDPRKSYPLVIYLHMGYVDEHAFLGLRGLRQLDAMIERGAFPPAIVACPDGTIDGRNRSRSAHSGYMNGVSGRFEDHVIQEVVPFLMRNYSVRPERQAHALVGASAGGFASLSLAIRYRSFFGAVATLAAPANGRYDNACHDHFADFDPATYRWRTVYDPDEIVGTFTFGLRRVPARRYIEPIFGSGPDALARIAEVNPADLLASTNLQPGELAIYLNYPGHDNWNFDAQIESFAWLASQRGVAVTLDPVPRARHNLPYFNRQHKPAYGWLAGHLLPPTP
jgi:S-formylglutathione hydrolase FrmB